MINRISDNIKPPETPGGFIFKDYYGSLTSISRMTRY